MLKFSCGQTLAVKLWFAWRLTTVRIGGLQLICWLCWGSSMRLDIGNVVLPLLRRRGSFMQPDIGGEVISRWISKLSLKKIHDHSDKIIIAPIWHVTLITIFSNIQCNKNSRKPWLWTSIKLENLISVWRDQNGQCI